MGSRQRARDSLRRSARRLGADLSRDRHAPREHERAVFLRHSAARLLALHAGLAGIQPSCRAGHRRAVPADRSRPVCAVARAHASRAVVRRGSHARGDRGRSLGLPLPSHCLVVDRDRVSGGPRSSARVDGDPLAVRPARLGGRTMGRCQPAFHRRRDRGGGLRDGHARTAGGGLRRELQRIPDRVAQFVRRQSAGQRAPGHPRQPQARRERVRRPVHVLHDIRSAAADVPRRSRAVRLCRGQRPVPLRADRFQPADADHRGRSLAAISRDDDRRDPRVGICRGLSARRARGAGRPQSRRRGIDPHRSLDSGDRFSAGCRNRWPSHSCSRAFSFARDRSGSSRARASRAHCWSARPAR